jgi:hypothetical protein
MMTPTGRASRSTTMTERKIVHRWTPNGWLEHFEPTFDPEELRRIAERQPPMTEQEQLAASLRYVRSRYAREGITGGLLRMVEHYRKPQTP